MGIGSYRRIEGTDIRPGVGEFKEPLTQAIRGAGELPQTEGVRSIFFGSDTHRRRGGKRTLRKPPSNRGHKNLHIKNLKN